MPAPLVSFVLLAYNQQAYIREAVEGAFSQTYSPLEIILSDDCSKDETFEIMQEMAAAYSGPHRILLNRNSSNLGIGIHYNKVMELASGAIVELAAGDDISLPWRTVDSVRILEQDEELSCISLGIYNFEKMPILPIISRQEPKLIKKWTLIDFLGTPGFFVNAPARAFRKFAHDQVGPLLDRCPVEDGPNLLRCLLHGKAASFENIGVLYRWNGNNISNPINILKIQRSLIYADYLSAIEIGFRKGLIDRECYEKAKGDFEKRMERFMLIENYNIGKHKLISLWKIFGSSHFSTNEKGRTFIKWMLGVFGCRSREIRI
jgi:glycosyltransferase involved in cell wall biosynthesis